MAGLSRLPLPLGYWGRSLLYAVETDETTIWQEPLRHPHRRSVIPKATIIWRVIFHLELRDVYTPIFLWLWVFQSRDQLIQINDFLDVPGCR